MTPTGTVHPFPFDFRLTVSRYFSSRSDGNMLQGNKVDFSLKWKVEDAPAPAIGSQRLAKLLYRLRHSYSVWMLYLRHNSTDGIPDEWIY
jgi:hypothetical protein